MEIMKSQLESLHSGKESEGLEMLEFLRQERALELEPTAASFQVIKMAQMIDLHRGQAFLVEKLGKTTQLVKESQVT